MKKMEMLMTVCAIAFMALTAHSATYNQASQQWVNYKLAELENRISSQINGINNQLFAITNSVEYSNSVNSAISYMTSSAASSFSSISFVQDSSSSETGSVFMISGSSDAFVSMFSSIPAITNVVKYGTILKKVGEDSYSLSNDGVVLSVEKTAISTYDMTIQYGTQSAVLTNDGDGGFDFVMFQNENVKVSAYECVLK